MVPAGGNHGAGFMKRKLTKPKNRHTFYFSIEGAKPIPAPAVVKPGKKVIEILLTATHVREAIAAHGRGNSQKCAGAVCSKDHGHLFPHPLHFVDWLDTRAYFATKINRKTMLPAECAVYTHNDNVAKMFDSVSGMKKLLKDLEENGPRTLKLYPPKIYEREKGRPRGKATGERKRVLNVTRGAPGRIIRAGLGLSAA
jgi:hypothetical protein